MPGGIAKSYEISDAKIVFVSLVDKAANKRGFLITKAEGSKAEFRMYGRILKADADRHFVTGVVYEPMVEDTDGNFMTEEKITKAAHWFMKNAGGGWISSIALRRRKAWRSWSPMWRNVIWRLRGSR